MSPMNRRQFLENSLFALAAAGAAASLPLYAAEGKPSSPVSANEKLGLAIIGGGSRSKDHISGFLKTGRATILYLCDPDPKKNDARIEEIAAQQGGIRPKFIQDMREAFTDKAVDIVSCATTNHWHTLCGLWALEAGKHAYLEKPISHNLHEGFVIEAAAKKYGKVVQTGTQCRSSKALINAVQFVREGGIGETKFARGLCYKRRASIGAKGIYESPQGLNYELWSGPAGILPITRPKFHYDWHWQREYGNGDLGNQGPHQTDIARWFLDLDRYPASVLSYGGRLGYQAERNDDSYVDAGDTANTEVSIFDYGDRCIVFETRGLDTPALSGPKAKDPKTGAAKVGVLVYGTKGYVVQSTYGYCAAFNLDGEMVREFKGMGDHYGNFLDAVIANDPSLAHATARTGALSAALSHMGNISYYLGENNKVSVSDLQASLQKIKSLDDNLETLTRTVDHLKKNKVDLAKYPISLGPLLAFDVEKSMFRDTEAQKLVSRDYAKGFEVKLR